MVLLRAVSEAAARLGLRDRRVLVAVSGGLDSVALLQALREASQGLSLELAIGHVNHGLRREAEGDEAAVRAHAARLGLRLAVSRVDPPAERAGRSSRDRPTLQEAARSLRYAALRAQAAELGADHVATAHHLDDQAETVLLRLLRGSGPDGLGGIPERSPDGVVVRPLLGVSRRQIEHFARTRHLTWREDASNASLDYARSRLRQRWLPGLAGDFNPQLLNAIGNLAEAQRRDSEWIAAQVGREAAGRLAEEDDWLWIDAKDWQALPEALARRLLREALRRCGAGRLTRRASLERMERFLAEARPGTAIELPGSLRLERRREGFRLGPRPATGPRDAC